ncbi:MAG: SPOR domain-containing protein [Alphaproteobacteria bacterium]
MNEDKSFFEELDKKLGEDKNDFSYKPTAPENKGFPTILIILIVVFIAVAIILFSEFLSRSEKTNEAVLPNNETTIEVEDKEKTMDAISEEDVKDAEEALENASIKGEENVKAEVEKREVPAPEKVKKVKKIKQPKKIKTGSSKPAKKTKQIAEKKTIPAGWQIQLAAVSSYKNAENEWNRLRILHPLLKKQTHEIFEKNIHGKKIYRLRVVGMSSRDSADSLCADLQTEGLACLVMR